MKMLSGAANMDFFYLKLLRYCELYSACTLFPNYHPHTGVLGEPDFINFVFFCSLNVFSRVCLLSTLSPGAKHKSAILT